MTSSTPPEETQAQSASILSASSSLDDPGHLYFHTLHHGFHNLSFSRVSQHPNPNDGAGRHSWPPAKSKAEGNFGTVCQSQSPVGLFAGLPQSFCASIFPSSVRLHSFHTHHEHATQILHWVCHAYLDREYSRSRKFLPLTNDKLVQAELALCFWKEHNNLYVWAPIPLFVERADYRCLELALIQEWQPRLNDPFICQFFHPKKGVLKKPAMNTNAQFGLATLWRRAKHKFTPQVVKDILASDRFQNHLELWTIIHALGSNTKARFEQTKMLRSNEGGLTLCYTLRRLANNIQEPYRTLSLQAIDASIRWWRGKPAPRASALRAPWSLSPNLQKTNSQTISSKLAPPGFGSSSPVPHTVFQDGFCQACVGA